MTRDELLRVVEQYGAGIDAELNLLRQLSDVAKRQREATDAGRLIDLGAAGDSRDEIMRSLVTIENGLRDLRQTLLEHRDLASRIEGFEEVAARHREAHRLVSLILSTDRESLSALADAELARRSAVIGLERGETTLAAYRRVLAPPVASAALLDRRG